MQMEFEPCSGKLIEEVLVATQQYLVFQLAQKYTSIRSDDGKPWIRCIGFTQTLDGARALAKKAFAEGDKMETRIMPVGKVFLAGATRYEGLDLPRREEEQQKANRLYEEWVEQRKLVHKEVAEKAKAKVVLPDPIENMENIKNPLPSSIPQRPPTPIPDTVPLLDKIGLTPMHLTSEQVWACGIIPDATEPALLPLFSADSYAEIQPLVKEAAKSVDLIHIDIFVGNVGEWLPLSTPQAEEKLHHHPLLQQATKEMRWLKQ